MNSKSLSLTRLRIPGAPVRDAATLKRMRAEAQRDTTDAEIHARSHKERSLALREYASQVADVFFELYGSSTSFDKGVTLTPQELPPVPKTAGFSVYRVSINTSMVALKCIHVAIDYVVENDDEFRGMDTADREVLQILFEQDGWKVVVSDGKPFFKFKYTHELLMTFENAA